MTFSVKRLSNDYISKCLYKINNLSSHTFCVCLRNVTTFYFLPALFASISSLKMCLNWSIETIDPIFNLDFLKLHLAIFIPKCFTMFLMNKTCINI